MVMGVVGVVAAAIVVVGAKRAVVVVVSESNLLNLDEEKKIQQCHMEISDSEIIM